MLSLELTVMLFGIQTVLGIKPFNWGFSYYNHEMGFALIVGPIHFCAVDVDKVIRASLGEK